MATITITRDLTARGLGTSSLVPIFVRNSMEFTVNGTDAEIFGSYATVKIGAYEYRCIKTIVTSTEHTYIIDVTSILSSLMEIVSSYDYTEGILTYSPSIEVRLYTSAGVFITSVNHPSIKLCLAYSDINTFSEIDIYIKGSSRAIYHNGKICFYNNKNAGARLIGIDGTPENEYTLFGGYSPVTLDDIHKINGTLVSSYLPTLSIPLYYKPPYGEHEIAWLNRDGAWSFWNFRQISSEIKVKRSNEVATYYPTNYETIAMSRMISAEKTVEYTFDTIAYDPTHFAQLCEIQESLAVIWNNKLMRVSGCNSLTSVCKQNLRFTLKLQSDENIAGY